MRVTVGAIVVLGLAVTVAAAQPGRERAAALKAPQALAPGELPPVARGAVDDFPSPPQLSSTPVGKSAARMPGGAGPAWLSGVDPNVLPVAGSASKTGFVRPLTPPPTVLARDEAPAPPSPKLLDRIKNFAGSGEKPPAPQPLPRPAVQNQPQPEQQPQPPVPTASTAFRGTGMNGAPVFAGPPAYRWFGWGTVTPGANPAAPAGQYPKASANWYSITGATPGAFPVPVANPARIAPGTEPPSYGLAARPPAPSPVVPVASQPYLSPQFVERPETSKLGAPPESKFLPGPGIGALPPPAFSPPSVPAPALTPPPIPKPATVVAPPVLPPPAVPAAPVVAAPAVPAAPLLPPAVPKPATVAALAPVLPAPALPPVSPVPSVEPAKPAAPAVEPKSISATPAPLPTSVTADPPAQRDELKWQQSTEPAAPRPGTWAPATDAKPLPTVPVEAAPGWQSGGAKVVPIAARAQFNDNTPDPIATLINQMCKGRAEGVEVRWTGTKKLQVCFEVRGTAEAQKLVNEISRRPEVTAYQIDFCVLVK